MKKEYIEYYCDVCKLEKKESEITKELMPVIIKCSQEDGYATDAYVKFEKIDICKQCLLASTNIEYGFRSVKGFKVNK